MGNDSKSAAAIAAVLHYIKTEQEAIGMQSAMAVAPQMQVTARQPAPVIKPWGVSGRQAQMQMRNLMQMRTFRKL
ncbi:MAG: hypothetical protein PVF29_00905 [Desulfobacterales bacterium]|jgi:hypothetical protein